MYSTSDILLSNSAAIFIVLLLILLFAFSILFFFRNLRHQKNQLERVVKERTSELNKSYFSLQDQRDEIIAQNEEIQAQNEEIILQRDEIQQKNDQLELSYQKIKLLGEFGKQLTSTLKLSDINDMIYNYVSSLLDTSVFGIGVYFKPTNSIVFERFMEGGNAVPEFSSSLDDNSSCSAWCFKNQHPIISNNFKNEYLNFISVLNIRSSELPKSLIYLPLTVMDKKIGVLTVQSYRIDAYSEKDVQTLLTLASYIAIALDNAEAYEIVKSQNEELEKHRTKLEKLVLERTKELEKAKAKAIESDKLKSAFLANMSHEIRTPLNAIIGFVNLLHERRISDEEKQEFYDIIQSNGFTLLNLINDILDFSKIEAGQLEFSYSEIKIEKLFDELFHTFNEEIRRIKKENADDLRLVLNTRSLLKLPVLITDYFRLKQIFTNLINNSIKFTQKGSIEFGIKNLDNNGFVTFYVKDTGIGIDHKNFDVVFDRFRKIEDDKIKLYRGAGLGLSITKYLVEHLGGEIQLFSEIGTGSEFIFTHPVTNKEFYTEQSILNISSKDFILPEWTNNTIMIVEDEISNFLVITSMLKRTQIKILWAKNGEEAISLFSENKKVIDVILMDIKLPKMDGFEAARQIKQLNERTPIVAQTAYALPTEENLIREANFDNYISKPFVRDKLIRILSDFIKN